MTEHSECLTLERNGIDETESNRYPGNEKFHWKYTEELANVKTDSQI